MTGQLHAGQLRYHDFSLLREARYLRQRKLSSILNSHGIVISGTLQSNCRSIFTASFQKLKESKLKATERIANENLLQVEKQHAFLQQLSEEYPSAVIERVESNPNFAMDDRCALLYLQCLEKNGKLNEFKFNAFLERLQIPFTAIDPMKLQLLKNVDANLTNYQKARKAMDAIVGRQSIQSSGTANILRKGIQYGSDSKYPLNLQVIQKSSFREQVFKLAYYGLGLLFITSAIGALFDEKGVSKAFGMGNSKHLQQADGSNISFKDVKGVDEAKAELEEIVLYLKNPEKFTRLGGKLPRGLLLTGPPGTGKTLLAKAIAGEAQVPFFFSSGSQFEEVYVGLGAKRIRELFDAAKQKAPAIIFIDEIDAVGGSRKLKDQSALKMTLNELLVQLDGFEDNIGIIVIGATNFAESLDKALLRPGRFDKNIAVPLPDVGGRQEILEMYAQRTKLSSDVNLEQLARGTVGFSGADLYNLMNQAALKASVEGYNSITMSVLEYAKDKILMGAERKTAVITPETARVTAFHEAGHAIIAVLTEGADPVHKATIMPRGQSLGMVQLLPEKDQTSVSKKQLLARMDVCMGGRIGEELLDKENITSGAVSDIQQATNIARAMVYQYGMSPKIGMVFYDEEPGSRMQALIDSEIKRFLDDSMTRSKLLLEQNKKQHHLLAETLLEYETLTGDEVRDIILRGKKPNRPTVNHNKGAIGDQTLILKKSPFYNTTAK